MTKQPEISFVMVAKLSKERMLKLHHLVFVNESKTNSAATPSEEKQKDEVLNNQVVDFHSYSAKK